MELNFAQFIVPWA